MSIRRSKFAITGIGAALALALAITAAPASADADFCPPGAGAGQCALPIGINSLRGVAVDHETGRIYVADKNNNRVNVFDVTGSFLFAFGWGVDTGVELFEKCTTASSCQAGKPGSGTGQFERADRIVVDNDPVSPSRHDVYVVDGRNHRVQKFSPAGEFLWMIGEGVNQTTGADLCTEASGNACGVGTESDAEGGFEGRLSVDAGGGGIVHVLDQIPLGANEYKHRLQRFDDDGNLIPSQCILFEGREAVALAAEPDGELWVASPQAALRRYDAACAEQLVAEESEELLNNFLARDGASTLFTVQLEGPFWVVTAYDEAGQITRRFGYGKLPDFPEGLAARAGVGVFLSLGETGIRQIDLPPPGPIATGVEVEEIGAAKASVAAQVNPEGKVTGVRFEYLTQADYEAQGDSFTGPATESTPEVPLGAEGFSLEEVEATLGCPNPATEVLEADNDCLQPETQYRFRVLATNADGPGEGTLPGEPFTTAAAVEFGDTYATDPGTDTVSLSAEVDPQALPATGRFQYVDEAAYIKDVEEGGDGFATAIEVPDVDGGAAPLDFGSAEGELTTRSVSLYPLEPGTAYRYRLVVDNPLVQSIAGEPHRVRTFAPVATGGCPANEDSRIGPGVFLPDCRAYELVSPLDKAGGDIRLLTTNQQSLAVLEQAANSGEKLAYGSARSFGDEPSSPWTSQYIAHRVEGSEWQTHGINAPRGRPLLPAAGQADTELEILSTDLCEGWIKTFAELPGSVVTVPGYVPQHSNLLWRTDRLCSLDREDHLEALAPFTQPEPPEETFVAEPQGVSADGEHAIFTTTSELEPKGTAGQSQLYESVRGVAPRLVCILPGEVPVSGPCTAGSTLSGANNRLGTFTGAISDDGQRIFFSTSSTGAGKLFVRIGGTETKAVSQVAETQSGTSASWFWSAATDGSRAIFTTGDLNNGLARLYAYEPASGATSLLAQGLYGVVGTSEDASRVYFVSSQAIAGSGENSEGDEAQGGEPNLYVREEGVGTSFVATLAMEDRSSAVDIKAFDHTPRVSPDGLHVAFISVAPLTGYDNEGAFSGTPTRELYLYDADAGELLCVSCNPSGVRPAGQATIPPLQSGMHGARLLADDGSHLYFESADRLVARDTNGHIDVYQWEEAGVRGCTVSSASFASNSGGCVDLISSGQAPLDSRFVEATPDGENVFFATVASLLPHDYGLVDIYDARVDGGLPVPQPSPPGCEGEACQSPPAAPNNPTPASSAFQGAGNVEEGGVRPKCRKGKRRVVRKGKSRCVPKRKSKAQRKHRQANQGRAAR